MGARFEFHSLEGDQVLVQYYDHDDEKTIEETHEALIPGMAFAANMILKAYVMCAMDKEAQERDGLH